ncbi:MAG: TrbI/VirB10 family protein, partial [Xanthobacteraceae bacterium]|nr:TrbI/VirB10 family protein [Xanthobacteraceae bacterium]
DVPVPPIGAQPGPPDPHAEAAEAARQRAAQERDAARTSSVFLGSGGAHASAEPISAPGLPASSMQEPASPPAQGDQAGKRAFMAQAENQRTVSVERLTAPASPNIVQAGSIIPAALITGVRSDLPGQITAQVTANVYDSPTGRILLIPQGARLIGEYDSEIAAGQTRVLLAWDRLIMPDGRSIVLERQPGADGAGFAGLQDRVNQHWGNLLRAAAVSTLLGVGTELGADSEDDLTRALRRGSQDTINQTGQQIVRRQLNVQPTLTVRPGHPLRVVLTRDLVLEPIGGPR